MLTVFDEKRSGARASFWIEVTTGMRWDRLLREGVRLDAPNRTRYQHFFEGMKSGDLVLHYLATTLTLPKERQSSVIGVSQVASNPAVVGKKIIADCSNTLELPMPVSCGELMGLKRKSPALQRLLGLSMQRYLTQISKSDFEFILNVHPHNIKRFSKSPLARMLRKAT